MAFTIQAFREALGAGSRPNLFLVKVNPIKHTIVDNFFNGYFDFV